jgi:hypothetical protein
MKKMLTKLTAKVIYYFVDGEKIYGKPDGIRGDLSDISGDLSDIRGNLSGIRGNLSNIRGNLSNIRGDLDDCEISSEDRDKGIHISELIAD